MHIFIKKKKRKKKKQQKNWTEINFLNKRTTQIYCFHCDVHRKSVMMYLHGTTENSETVEIQ